MTVRIVVAFCLFALLAALAWWLERRRRHDAPTQSPALAPTQLDRADFPRPTRRGSSCCSRRARATRARVCTTRPPRSSRTTSRSPRSSTSRNPALHERYHVDAAPMTLVADADGVVRSSFVGAFAAPDLWTAVAELRAS